MVLIGVGTGGTAVVALVATAHSTTGGRRGALHLPGCDLWMQELRAAAAAAALVQFGVLVYVLTALWIVAAGLLLVFLVAVWAALDAFVQHGAAKTAAVQLESLEWGGLAATADLDSVYGSGSW
ncbi:hypothetical protein HK405_004029 [Cladochytrium tenue]|nr:hypothetical protein HK405_004029 [Cladochytrium tenue]